jgi:uncharacterized membrane protein
MLTDDVMFLAWSAVTDLLLAIYPVFIIWNLRTPRKRKVIISVLMGFGVFSAGFGMGKTIEYSLGEGDCKLSPM